MKKRFKVVVNMGTKFYKILMIVVLLFPLLSVVEASDNQNTIQQFGVGFDEVVIASSLDGLDEPRDLEFHPGIDRNDELWIVNRVDDSMVIIHNTGTETQTSEERLDAYRNHFMEEVSAIAFGAYNDEFDYQFGTAQESRNTYNGANEPNDFMGPALWPSSLSHFAVENQNGENGLLGSHIDMLHESPLGMGIAHDYDNVYWYNDGFYGELVRYDFQEDHDTGEHDHSDGIVHRYSEIELSRFNGVPGHMILDKTSGVLYISDTGANRVLWVNTDDSSTTSTNIIGDSSQLEPLEEYLRISDVEWGILDVGLDRPSGIAIEGNILFISEYGNGKINAYNLNEDGKGGIFLNNIQTSAQKIMGLEVGPNGHLYYVDNGRNEVVRIDPYFDVDEDGIIDKNDNCLNLYNPDQEDYDEDSIGNSCDDDDDNDDVIDDIDLCPRGDLGWSSWTFSDFDGDGCRDDGEDLDDDGDGVCDGLVNDINCNVSSLSSDLCPNSPIGFVSDSYSDNDGDGCEDISEDNDDDNDGYHDSDDDCPVEFGSSDIILIGCLDNDNDGYSNNIDVFPIDSSQWNDTDGDGFGDELFGTFGDYCPEVYGNSTNDRYGCLDSDGDGYSDVDVFWGIRFGGDAFTNDSTQWIDSDGDGYGDNERGNQPDKCPNIFGKSYFDVFGCLDNDGDGWSNLQDDLISDSTQWIDSDKDGYGDNQGGNQPDACPNIFGNSTIERYGCVDSDGDGLDDELDVFPFDSSETVDSDGDGVGDNLDVYPLDSRKTESSSFNYIVVISTIIVVITLVIVTNIYLSRKYKN